MASSSSSSSESDDSDGHLDADDEATLARLAGLSRSERVEALFGFAPWDYQAKVLDAPQRAESARTSVTFVGGRSIGKTRTAAAIPADYALCNPGADVAIYSRFGETASELFRETKRHLRNTGLDDDALGVSTANKTEWEFASGARIFSRTLSHDGEAQRGRHPECIVIDEAALVGDRVFERVVEPMLAAHESYEIYLVSTPRGKSGYLYRKHARDDAWLSIQAPSSASPLIDAEWLENKRESVDSLTWRQEYLGEFVESEDAYLPHSIIDPCVGGIASSSIDAETGESIRRRWLGVDPARSGKDYSAYVSVAENGRVRVEAHVERETTDEAVGRIKALDRRAGGFETVVVEENGLGAGVVDFSARGLANVRPFTSTAKSKQAAYQTLKRCLESGEVTLPNNRRFVEELTSLEYSFTQHGILRVDHRQGGFSDLADALALAVLAWQRGASATTTRSLAPPKYLKCNDLPSSSSPTASSSSASRSRSSSIRSSSRSGSGSPSSASSSRGSRSRSERSRDNPARIVSLRPRPIDRN